MNFFKRNLLRVSLLVAVSVLLSSTPAPANAQVQGSSFFRLDNAFTFVWGAMFDFVVICGLILIFRALYRRYKASHPTLPPGQNNVASTNTNQSGTSPVIKETQIYLFHKFYTPVGAGVVLLCGPVLFPLSLFVMATSFGRPSPVQIFLMYLGITFTMLAIMTLPSLIVGIKRGWKAGVSVFLNALLTGMIVALFLALLSMT